MWKMGCGLRIAGLQKTTLLDFPGHVAATVFLGGCNFRCPFCHNGNLLDSQAPLLLSEEELMAFLQKRSRVLDGVCITGGEPTLQPDELETLIRNIRTLGLLVKLDTNGSRPHVLKSLCRQKLLDFVSMDIKAAPHRYPVVCGQKTLEMSAVLESVEFLKTGALPYEFRTTVVKGLHTEADFRAIGPWIAGCPHYYLQNYVVSEQVLCPDGLASFSPEELLAFAEIVRPFVGEVALRGVDG